MSTADRSHIAPEVLEEAACGHLDPARFAAVEAHCAVCAQCKTAYDEELRIARGTRSWARAALKSRLASRVGAPRSTPLPWTRILAAAAALLLIAGTGIVYQWLRVTPEPTVNTVISAHSVDSILAPGVGYDSGHISGELADARALNTPPPAAPAKASVRDEERARLAKREGDALDQAAGAAPSAEGEALSPVNDTHESARTMASRSTNERIVWGNVIAAEETKDKAAPAQQPYVGEAAMEARGAQMQGVRKMITQPIARFTLDQDVLPGVSRRDAGTPSGQIPARFSRSGDTIRIVLLMDALLPADAIRSATVLTFPPDSLQVHIPGKVFGFRTPPGFLP